MAEIHVPGSTGLSIHHRPEAIPPGTAGAAHPAFKITNKVVRLMERIAEAGYASMREIELLFTSEWYRYHLVRNLSAHGMLKTLNTHIQPSRAYYLTAQGYDVLESMGRLRVQTRFVESDYRITTCLHNLNCLAARLVLEKQPRVSDWRPERVLDHAVKRDKRLVDAEFDLGDSHFGLEMEITLKAPKVLKDNMDRLRAREDLSNILWVIQKQNVFESIRRAYGMASGFNRPLKDEESRHLFVYYNDLVTHRLKAKVFNLAEKAAEIGTL